MLHHAFTALLPQFILAITTALKLSSSHLIASFAHAKNVA
jgi:hypothetical protein